MDTTTLLQSQEFSSGVWGVYKPAGQTPLQTLDELRLQQPTLANTLLTYAGRLDPMAEGLLLVLAGDMVHKKPEFLGLDKIYTVTALLGIATDSYDLLGMPVFNSGHSMSILDNSGQLLAQATPVLQSLVGTTTLPLPPFSSPPHQGKPLFWWARKQPTVHIAPLRTTHITNISTPHFNTIEPSELSTRLHTYIPRVHGDFRQADILGTWDALLQSPQKPFTTITFTVHCQSGTYIRSLVHELGAKLGTGACIYQLVRTHVGNYQL